MTAILGFRSIGEFARYLGVHPQTIKKHLKRGLSGAQIKQVVNRNKALKKGGHPCDQCGTPVPKGSWRFCSLVCSTKHGNQKMSADRAQARAANPWHCNICGIEIQVTRWSHLKYCSRVCQQKAQNSRRADRYTPRGHNDGLLVTTIEGHKFPADNRIKFTKEGIEFVAACLLTPMTFPQIAAAVGVNFWSFTHLLLRRTPELTPYREIHHQIVREARKPKNERQATCSRCTATYTQCRNQNGRWPDRHWCDKCLTEHYTPLAPEERRRKARERYQQNKESEQRKYREYYTRNREKEIDKTRRNKAIKKYGLNPERWREEWKAIGTRGLDPEWREQWPPMDEATGQLEQEEKERQWIQLGKQALARVRKHLSQRV
jgi:hypothetical protein